MKALKSFSLLLGEQMLLMNNFSHKDNTPTPLFLDEDRNIVIQHQTATKKQIIDLSKVLMYSYELDEQPVTQ